MMQLENFSMLILLGLPLILFNLYFFIGSKLNITDKPGSRSSHNNATITGSGVVFSINLLIINFWLNLDLPIFFILGLFSVVFVSYWDDIKPIRHTYRFIIQLISLIFLVSVVYIDTDKSLIELFPVWIAAIIFGIGVLNAFNFIDGINGMLGLSSLVILISLAYINFNLTNSSGLNITFVEQNSIYAAIGACVIFLIYNLRAKAKTFMGDAGSIGLGFIILFFIYQLIATTGNIAYLLLFSVIGIDSGLTVIFKLLLKQNIFVPHRDFLFKRLVHVGKYGHVRISVIYALVQAIINVVIIKLPIIKGVYDQISTIFIVVLVLVATYIYFRNKLTKSRVLKFLEKNNRTLISSKNNTHSNIKPMSGSMS
jgi:UDP-GlcNAc:undecaprenyl-phosphate GlcNAc-1-phosphate transferase